MDPQLDPPPPLPAQLPVAPPSFPTALPNHPPYPEMITTAIRELNEPEGSSKRAISKFIEARYPNLPPIHSDLLSNHIKLLKSSSQLVMFKNSYKLPGSAPTNGAVTSATSDPPPAGTSAKRRGRPPKVKAPEPAVAVPVFENANATPVVVPVGNSAAVNGQTPARGRGRPRKAGGGTPKVAAAASGGTGRGRGRPKKVAAPPGGNTAAPVVTEVKRSGRPRGRPRKLLDVNEGVVVGGTSAPAAAPAAAAVVAGKRRGRPPKAGSEAAKRQRMDVAPKRVRKFSGKPLGRPRKQVTMPTPAQAPDSQLLVAYLDVKAKYDNLQSRVKQSAGLIKSSLTNQEALNAFQELEGLAEVHVNPPANVQIPQPPAEAAPQAQPAQPQQPQPVIPQF